jgi:Predicted membrane protein (DUF2157)
MSYGRQGRHCGGMATSEQLARWVAAGLIDSGQADRIKAFEATRVDREPPATQAAPGAGRVPVIAEAMGYVGVTVVLVAGLLTAEPAWPRWSTGLRLTLIAAVTVALAVAGAAVPAERDPVWRRLRGLAWLLSVVGLALFAAGLADWVWHLSDQHVGLVTAGAATAYSLVLWLRHTIVPQHLALFVAVTSLTGVVIAEPDVPSWWPGIGIWLVSATWLIAGSRGWLRPVAAALPVAGVGMLVGSELVIDAAGFRSQEAVIAIGYLFGFAAVGGLLSAGIRLHRIGPLVVSAVGILYFLPEAARRYLPGSFAIPVAVFAVGVLLVALAVRLSRWRTGHAPAGLRGG